MRLLYLGRVVAEITAIFHVAGALAYPGLISAELVAGEEDHHQLESRAIVGSTTIPLQSVKGNDGTVIGWVGFKAASLYMDSTMNCSVVLRFPIQNFSACTDN
jgi:hypothetical protein